MGWISLRKGMHRYLPSLTIQPKIVVEETLKRLNTDAKICDVGAGGRKITPTTFTIDGFSMDNTDLVCDIHDIKIGDGTFDCVFCTGTLEHVQDPNRVLDEIIRITRQQGLIHIEVPFMQGYHADPEDYWRWTLDGLKIFCKNKGLEEIESGVHIGPSSTLTWIIAEYSNCLLGENFFGKLMSGFIRVLVSPLKLIDYHLNKNENAKVIASGVYFVGMKT